MKEKPMLENTEGSEIQKDELKSAMEKMKENKAAGDDGIVSEGLSDDFGIDKVTDEIYNRCKRMRSLWVISLMSQIPKLMNAMVMNKVLCRIRPEMGQ